MRRLPALLAIGLLAAPVSAFAQSAPGYGPRPGAAPPPSDEQVIINAPHLYRERQNRLNTPLENVSLSVPVAYGDLDLRSRWGVRELHARIRTAAYDVCSRLIDAYPVGENTDDQCFNDAVAQARPQADAAVQRARSYADSGY